MLNKLMNDKDRLLSREIDDKDTHLTPTQSSSDNEQYSDIPDVGIPDLNSYNVIKNRENSAIYSALNRLEDAVDTLISCDDSMIATWGPLVSNVKNANVGAMGKLLSKINTKKINWGAVDNLIDSSGNNLEKMASIINTDLRKFDNWLIKNNIKDTDVINRFETIVKKYIAFMKGHSTPGFVKYISIFSSIIQTE